MAISFGKKHIAILALAVIIGISAVILISGLSQSDSPQIVEDPNVPDQQPTQPSTVESSEPTSIQMSESPPGMPRAVIIDQLYRDYPNEEFHEEASKYLRMAGYHVDIYTTADLTVDFYKKLSAMNYEYVLFRTHGLHQGVVENSASIFTGDQYSTEKYVEDQLAGNLKKGAPFDAAFVQEHGWEEANKHVYFTVGSNFVNNAMTGTFPQSTIIIGGCDALSGRILAEALVKRGATDIIGWNGLVTSTDNDVAVLHFLEKTLTEDMDVREAIEGANKLLYPGRALKGNLVYYDKFAI